MLRRESEQGKLNAVTLRMIHSGGVITDDEAIKELKSNIGSKRRELPKLVLQEKSSVVPRACTDLFYMNDDGFTLHEMINNVKVVIEEPIVLNEF